MSTVQWVIRRLPAADLARMAEVDRSEHITRHYRVENGRLVEEVVDWQVPTWPDDKSEYGLAHHQAQWAPILAAGGVLLGALDGERLAGFAILRPRLEADVAQLAVLHVGRPYRRRGLASQLLARAERLAIEAGARQLYISATPSGSAIGFYFSQGFGLVDRPHPELFALEPEDIHLIKRLAG